MRIIALITIGGGAGALSRFLLSRFINRICASAFPWGTLGVNLLGCLFIGILYELFNQSFIPGDMRNFFVIGFLGAFTTFSSYALESMILIRDKNLSLMIMNIFTNNIFGMMSVVIGILAARFIISFFRAG